MFYIYLNTELEMKIPRLWHALILSNPLAVCLNNLKIHLNDLNIIGPLE